MGKPIVVTLLVIALLGAIWTPWLSAAECSPTPRQGEGPYYPVEPIPVRSDLIGPGLPRAGKIITLSGKVMGADCRPLAGARVEIWQTDAVGHYDHPGDVPKERLDPAFRYFGAVLSDSEGRYRFRTMLPASYGSRPPHIHVKVFHPAHRNLTTQLYFTGTPNRETDWLYRKVPSARRKAVEASLGKPTDAKVGHPVRWDIVLAAG